MQAGKLGKNLERTWKELGQAVLSAKVAKNEVVLPTSI